MRPYYYSLNEYLTDTYGTKLYKLPLYGGMTCPNRDGTLDTRGCIFCSAGGSGEFTGAAACHLPSSGSAAAPSVKSVAQLQLEQQISAAKALLCKKYHGSEFIAYFQSFTNTYAPADYLHALFYPVIMRDDIRILSVATRPDCLSDDTIHLLAELNQIKPVWVELGLQTIHQTTADYIRRGYHLPVFSAALERLKNAGIYTIVHMIIGLPGEDLPMMLETADYIAHCKADGIKLQLLHVLKDTDLAKDYQSGKVSTLSPETYADCLGKILELLPKDMAIHRLTGDGPKRLLLAPMWSADKKTVLNSLHTYFKEHNIYQGRNFHEHGYGNPV